MALSNEHRELLRKTGVFIPDDTPADELGLTDDEAKFARRLNVTAADYAASKSITDLATFEAEMVRRRAAQDHPPAHRGE